MIEVTYPANAEGSFEPLHFDLHYYATHLEGLELTDAEAKQFLEALWEIMVAFVDLGFKIEPGPGNGPVGQIIKAAIALERESHGLLKSEGQFQQYDNNEMDRPLNGKVPMSAEDS